MKNSKFPPMPFNGRNYSSYSWNSNNWIDKSFIKLEERKKKLSKILK